MKGVYWSLAVFILLILATVDFRLPSWMRYFCFLLIPFLFGFQAIIKPKKEREDSQNGRK